MNLRPVLLASAITLLAGATIAGAQTPSSTDGRTGGAGPMGNNPSTGTGTAPSSPNVGGTARETTDGARDRARDATRDMSKPGDTATTPQTPNPSDGRPGGAGPMSGNPQTDKTLQGGMHSGSRMGGHMGGNMGHSNATVRQVQEALVAKGHDVGGVDGVMGPRTQAALREYQQAQGIQRSGRIDDATLSGLGIQSNRMMDDRRGAAPGTTRPSGG